MLTDLLRRLAGRPENDAPLPAEDQRIAVAALLVIAAHADHHYADIERVHIERALTDRYGLNPEAAAALRAQGEAAEQASVDLYRFTSLVKAGVPLEERAAIIEAMWRVILADAEREPHEEQLMRRVTDLLGVDPREGIAARSRAQAKLST